MNETKPSETLEDPSHSTVVSLARSGGALLFASLFGNGLNYAFGIFLARYLGAEDFGLFALSLTLFNTMVMIVLLGFNSSTIKFVSESLGRNDHSQAKQFVAFGLGLCVLMSGLGAGLLWGSGEWLATEIYARPELIPLFGIVALALPFSAISMLIVSALQAFQIIRYTIFVKYLWEPVGKFGVAWIFLTAGMGLPGVMIGMVLVFAGSVLIAFHGARRVIAITLQDFTTINRTIGKPFLLFCGPLIFANVFSALAPRFDVFLLGYFGQMEQVGIYTAAFQTAAVLSLILGSFDRTFAPAMGRLMATHDTAGLKKLYQSQTRMVTGMIMFPLMVFLVFGENVLKIFGQAFVPGYVPLMLLAIAQAWYCATGAASMVLLMGGHSRLIMVNTIGNGLCVILLGWMLIPLWGMEGAACAASLSLVGRNGIQIAQVWRKYRILPYSWGFMKFILAGTLTAVSMLLGKTWLADLSLFLWLPFGGLFYLGAVAFLRLEGEDRKLLRDLFRNLQRLILREEPKEAACA